MQFVYDKHKTLGSSHINLVTSNVTYSLSLDHLSSEPKERINILWLTQGVCGQINVQVF